MTITSFTGEFERAAFVEDESDDRRHKRALVPGLPARRNAQGIPALGLASPQQQDGYPRSVRQRFLQNHRLPLPSDLIVELLARHVVDPFSVLITPEEAEVRNECSLP